MPELPEIEVAKKVLGRVLVGKTIKSFTNNVPKMVRPSLTKLSEILPGRRIIKVDRRAKLLILRLDDVRLDDDRHDHRSDQRLQQSEALWLHLKLTGQLVYQAPSQQGNRLIMAGHPMENVQTVPNRFTHAAFIFDDASRLFFNDLRKFGYIRLMKEAEAREIKLGIEPLTAKFTLSVLKELALKRPNLKVKQFLLDQSLVAGLGNIYSDEVLHFAQVRPTRKMKNLSSLQLRKIRQGIKKILRSAIKHGSTSYDSYAGQNPETSNYTPYLKVYQRAGEPCSRDKQLIKRVKIAGRSAHYCARCQK